MLERENGVGELKTVIYIAETSNYTSTPDLLPDLSNVSKELIFHIVSLNDPISAYIAQLRNTCHSTIQFQSLSSNYATRLYR